MKLKQRSPPVLDLDEIDYRTSLDRPTERQWSLLVLFVGAALKAGLVPRDATIRALDALSQIRTFALANRLSLDDQAHLQHLLVSAMGVPSPETGATLAARAAESWRLLTAWRDGKGAPRRKRISGRYMGLHDRDE